MIGATVSPVRNAAYAFWKSSQVSFELVLREARVGIPRCRYGHTIGVRPRTIIVGMDYEKVDLSQQIVQILLKIGALKPHATFSV